MKHFQPIEESIERNTGPCPEKKLLAAILSRTILDVLNHRHDPMASRDKLSALKFLFNSSKGSKNGHFAFLYICEVLQLNPKKILEFVRKHQKVLKRKKIQGIRFTPYYNR